MHGHGDTEVEHVDIVLDSDLKGVDGRHLHDLSGGVECQARRDALTRLEESDLQLVGAGQSEAVLVELDGEAGEWRERAVSELHVHIDGAVATCECARHLHAFALLRRQPLLFGRHQTVGAHC